MTAPRIAVLAAALCATSALPGCSVFLSDTTAVMLTSAGATIAAPVTAVSKGVENLQKAHEERKAKARAAVEQRENARAKRLAVFEAQ